MISNVYLQKVAPENIEDVMNFYKIDHLKSFFDDVNTLTSSITGKTTYENEQWYRNVQVKNKYRKIYQVSKIDIKNAKNYYIKIKNIIQNLDRPHDKRRIIISLNNYQLALEQSLPTQSLNYLLLRNSLEQCLSDKSLSILYLSILAI